MTFASWIVILINAAAAATLIVAAIAKLVSPAAMRIAIGELLRSPRWLPADLGVRVFAACELTVAGLLSAATTRVLGGWLVACLGVLFAFAGTLGISRGGTASCGCLGSYADKPLGARNIAIGLAMIVVAPVNIVVSAGGLETSWYTRRALDLSAVLTIVLCLWVNRVLIVPLVRTLQRQGG
jgi:hypothetical protein